MSDYWIALSAPEASSDAAQPPPVDACSLQALGWWALGFTPRVVCVPDAVLLEVSLSLRLYGGSRSLVAALLKPRPPDLVPAGWARGATALGALGRLRAHVGRSGRCPDTPLDRLPLTALDEAQPHLVALQALGCRYWGCVRALPRDGVARRFGPALLQALDQAYGTLPRGWGWLELPLSYAQRLELAQPAETAPGLLFGARRLLAGLHVWLQARQLGVLSVQLKWAYAHRHAQTDAPTSLSVRSAQPQAYPDHLERLLAEHLQRIALPAPVQTLELSTLELAAVHRPAPDLLPPADPAPQAALYASTVALAERLTARLGAERVLQVSLSPHPLLEARQHWHPVQQSPDRSTSGPAAAGAVWSGRAASGPLVTDAGLWPTWLLDRPLPINLEQGVPDAPGPLTLRAGPHRVEAVGWPAVRAADGSAAAAQADSGGAQPAAALRDYYVAHSRQAGWLWVFCERLPAVQQGRTGPRWYLQGRFA